MSRFVARNEAVLHGSAEQCWKALMAELEGNAFWWEPYLLVDPLQQGRASAIGSEFEVVTNRGGHPERFWGTARWTWRTTMSERGRVHAMEYVSGALRGTIQWDFEPLMDDTTRVTVTWATDPAEELVLLSYLVSIPKVHDKVMKEAFKGMETYLERHLAA